MARIILKSPYYKPNASKSISGYLRYIATRDGVERPEDSKRFLGSTDTQKDIIKSLLRQYPGSREFYEYEDYLTNPNRENADEFIMRTAETYVELSGSRQKYVSYMATRPRAERLADNGLFSDDGMPIVLADAMREVENHTGNIWTHIISLRREDAERLGYCSVDVWMALLRSQRNMIAQEMRIAPENFRWYAAFHNESHHPHVHMMAFSTDPQEPYLSVEGIQNIKSNLAREIFRQDLISIYEKQTEQRDLLRSDTAKIVSDIVDSINHETYNNPQLEDLLLKLSERLKNTGGRKVYGYLKADVKAIVNSIVDEMQKDERIQKLYDLWYEQRFEVLRTYQDTMPEKVPLSENKDFKEVKNAVIREAMNLVTDTMTFEDDNIGYNTPKNIEKAMECLTRAADKGNQFAQYLLGKIYLSGESIPKDAQKAIGYLEKSAAQNNQWAQYVLGKVYLYGRDVNQDAEKGFALLMTSAEQGNPYAASVLKNYADNKKSSVGVGAIRLLNYLSRIFQDRLHDEHKFNAIDKKQRRQINDKKEAQGLRL